MSVRHLLRKPAWMGDRTAWAIAALGLVIALSAAPQSHAASQSTAAGPEAVLKSFLGAMYSRDAKTAYQLISQADRDVKTLDDYVAETGAFDGAALDLARLLARGIKYRNVDVAISGTRATVTFDAELPNANDPVVDRLVLGFNRSQLSRLSETELEALRDDVRRKVAAGQVPVLRSKGESWKLISEGGQWRVFQNWADAVEVRFSAATFHDLGWEFVPLRDHVMAKHGETLRMAYRVRNVGSKTTTGKARHIVGPRKDAGHLEIISCFCFVEQTLAPGEEAELPLMFRVDYDAPERVTTMNVAYEFYPRKLFPADTAAAGEIN